VLQRDGPPEQVRVVVPKPDDLLRPHAGAEETGGLPWHEMDVDGSLVCTILHPYWHTVEQDLRRKIYQYRHMPADMVLPPYLCLPPILKDPDFRYMGIPVSETVVQTDAKNDI